MFTLTNISVVLFATTAINLIATFISWQRRGTAGGRYFALGMAGITFWTLAASLDYAATPIPLKVFFAKLEYAGYNIAFASFGLFVLLYAGFEDWLDKVWVRALFWIIPLSNILLAWTNDWHGWLWSGFTRSDIGENTVIFEHGPGYLWAVVTGYLMILVIILPLWQASRRGSELSHRQARLLFAASLIPIVGNLLYLLESPQLRGVDWTPLSFSLAGVLFLLALFGTRLLDIVPIAHDKLVSSLADGMIVLDMQNRIIDVNDAAVRMLETHSATLIGKALTEVVSLPGSFSVPSPEQEMKTELQVGSTDKRYFDVLLSPLRDRHGKLLGSLIVFRNITERKENELRLLQLTQAVEQSPASVVITDFHGNITYVNPRFAVLTGYTPSEVIGKNPSVLQSGYTPEEVYREMWDTIKSGQTWQGEFLNRKKNGDLYWENAVIAPVMDQAGHVLNFIAVKEDITERKRAEDDLRTANQQLESRLREIEALQASLREQAIRDPLTHLHNRRFLSESIEQEFHHAKRMLESLSVILLDIDHFKVINDTYGHAVGDACLVALANLLRGHARKADISCRYGGEEFVLVLPATNLEGAAQYAERLRRLVANEVFIIDALELKFTISLGISAYPAHGTSHSEIINKADDAMYASKRAGRNRVTSWTEAHPIKDRDDHRE
jgi:diguanylate cyclase (GGDEF)-like protein/PAS domain S-box-containing protein